MVNGDLQTQLLNLTRFNWLRVGNKWAKRLDDIRNCFSRFPALPVIHMHVSVRGCVESGMS